MKLAKMSMVAALLLGANAYAIDNVKVSGDAKLYYGTQDSDAAGAPDMFNKDASYGDAALNLGLTADLSEGVSAGVSMTAVTTLGLENNLVSATWSNAHSASASQGASYLGGAQLQAEDEMWVGEAWLAGTAGKTTAKVGRQALDTPLVFSETWGIDKNTFEAAVLINQDIPDTTLVAAWVGKSNGSADDQTGIIHSGDFANILNATPGYTLQSTSLNSFGLAATGYVSQGAEFNTFAKDGAYAVGAINNSFKPLTAQAWYYDLQGLATAYWLQADIECSLVEGVLIGGQYTEVDPDLTGTDAYLGLTNVGLTLGDVKKTSAYSVMLGYAVKDVVTVKAAYSSVDEDGTLGVANTATGTYATSGGQSKLYTEMFWMRGAVSTPGADSYSITAEGTAAGVDLSAGYYSADIDLAGTANDVEVTEIALTAGKSFGPLDTKVAVIMDDIDAAGTADDEKVTSLQVYLTYNF